MHARLRPAIDIYDQMRDMLNAKPEWLTNIGTWDKEQSKNVIYFLCFFIQFNTSIWQSKIMNKQRQRMEKNNYI